MVLTSVEDPNTSADIIQDERWDASFVLLIRGDATYEATITVGGITETELHRRLIELYRVSRQQNLSCPHCEGPIEFDLALPDEEGEQTDVIEYAPMETTGMAGTEVDLPYTGVINVEGALALHDEAIHDPEPFGIASVTSLKELEREVEELREQLEQE
jgi:hypothetical protein